MSQRGPEGNIKELTGKRRVLGSLGVILIISLVLDGCLERATGFVDLQLDPRKSIRIFQLPETDGVGISFPRFKSLKMFILQALKIDQ
jgi:hypothetical protein